MTHLVFLRQNTSAESVTYILVEVPVTPTIDFIGLFFLANVIGSGSKITIGSSIGSTFRGWSGIAVGRRVRTVAGSMPTGKPVRLRRDPRFEPCPTEPGDELYPNGIFEFNICAFISAHPERFPTEVVELFEIPDYGSSKRFDEAAWPGGRPISTGPSG